VQPSVGIMTGLSARFQAGSRGRVVALAALLFLADCGPASAPLLSTAPAPDPTAGYVAPPEPLAVESAQGRLWLTGRATPGAEVRLAAIPRIRATSTNADPQGRFRLPLAGGPEMRLYDLAMSAPAADGTPRLVQSDGYLLIGPGAPPTLLRASTGARVLGAPHRGLRIRALDYDSAGGAVISGMAAPNTALNAQVDNVSRGQAQSAADGHFSIALAPLAPGTHQFSVAGGGATATVSLQISNAARLTPGPFRAERTAIGWRIDWLTPGGGLQTTLIFD
jgi:hypothetical protein